MILKRCVLEREVGKETYFDSWHFIDNVKEAVVRWSDELNCSIVEVIFKDERQPLTFTVCNDCYILSDEGKTIERIKVPEWAREQNNKVTTYKEVSEVENE